MLGWFLVATALVTAVVGVVGGIVLSDALGRLDQSAGEATRLADRTGAAAADTLDALDGALGDASAALSQAEQTVRGVATGLAAVGDPGTSASGSLAERAGAVADQIQKVGGSLSDWQARLSQVGSVLPLPSALTDAVGPLRQQLDGLAAQLRASQDGLRGLGTAVGGSGRSLSALADDLAALARRLDDRGALLGRYRAAVTEARAAAAGDLNRVSGGLGGARAAVLFLGLLLAAGQVLPLLVGWNLVRTTTPAPASLTPPGGRPAQTDSRRRSTFRHTQPGASTPQ